MIDQRKAEILDNCGFFAEDTGKSGTGTSVSLDFFGYEHCLPRHSYGPRVRLNYVIHVVIDGKGMLDCGGKRWMIRKGQMFILFPGEITTYYADKEDPWYYCWFGFQGSSAAKIVESIGFTPQTPVLSFGDGESVEKKIIEMLGSVSLTLDGQLHRNAEMMDILSKMIRERAKQAGSDSGEAGFSYSEYAVRYINNHFNEKIRIQELAKHDLLTGSNDPIRLIAAECGYEDALAFSKVFKSNFGQNPSDYRMLHNKSCSEE